MVKICSICSQEKRLEAFPKNSRGKFGRGQKCNSCSKEFAANYRKENPFRVKANKFKTTEETIERLLARNTCAICGRLPGSRRHALDHDHTTGKLRDLLCDFCNKGLGQFFDDPNLMRKAADYLELHKENYNNDLYYPHGYSDRRKRVRHE